jgi:hypothetical protein
MELVEHSEPLVGYVQLYAASVLRIFDALHEAAGH